MPLQDTERWILEGRWGEAPRLALQEQLLVAAFFGAERFVEVTNVHMMGDWEVMGESGCAYLEHLVSLGGRVMVMTTRNAQCVDEEYAARLRQSLSLIENERKVRILLQRLGVATVDTCINYQSLYQPRFGEHVAWGDTGAVIFANSVLGARTNYESGPAALAAALTGRTPAYGFHLDEHRRANVRCVVEARLEDVADWGALGAIVGERARNYWWVPAFEARSANVTADGLKHLGASLASYGSLAMFHLVGTTPEAPSFPQACGGREIAAEYTVTQHDLDEHYERCTPSDSKVDLVVFSAPQLSLAELDRLAGLLRGRKIHEGTTLLITTNPMNKVAAERAGLLRVLEAAGALVLQGVCWYIMDPAEMRRQFGWSRVVTNSAKLVNIIKAHGYEPILRRTEACVQTAITGELPR